MSVGKPKLNIIPDICFNFIMAKKTCQKRSIIALLIIQYSLQKTNIKWSIWNYW